MSATQATAAPPKASPPPIDWVHVLTSAFVAAALKTFAQAVAAQEQARRAAQGHPPNVHAGQAPPKKARPFSSTKSEAPKVVHVDWEAVAAANALGISIEASEDEIRAALRARLASSKIHPDQGGDGEEAKRLVAAKNLLVERKRAVRP